MICRGRDGGSEKDGGAEWKPKCLLSYLLGLTRTKLVLLLWKWHVLVLAEVEAEMGSSLSVCGASFGSGCYLFCSMTWLMEGERRWPVILWTLPVQGMAGRDREAGECEEALLECGLLLASSSLWEWSWPDSDNSNGAGDGGMSGSFPLLLTPLKISSLRDKCCLSAFSGPSKLICRAMQRRTAINPLLSLQAFH